MQNKKHIKYVIVAISLALFYFASRFVISSPYYDFAITYFEYPESRSLNSSCREFSIFNNIIRNHRVDRFVVDYIENGMVWSFSLRDYLSEDYDSSREPIAGTNFSILDTSKYNIVGYTILISEEFNVSIGVSTEQIDHSFFQNFITKYEQCIKGNFKFDEKINLGD